MWGRTISIKEGSARRQFLQGNAKAWSVEGFLLQLFLLLELSLSGLSFAVLSSRRPWPPPPVCYTLPSPICDIPGLGETKLGGHHRVDSQGSKSVTAMCYVLLLKQQS